MPALPVVGVIACRRSVEGEDAQIVKERYLDAVRRNADALPLIVPNNLDADDVINLLPRMDGTASDGQQFQHSPLALRLNASTARNARRDGATTLPPGSLRQRSNAGRRSSESAAAFRRSNVAFGGSLADERDIGTQEFSHITLPDDASLEAMFAHAHGATVVPGAAFEKVLGVSGPIAVNSVHYQRIDRLGHGLTATVHADDGVIEAVAASGTRAPVFAVQWHPEWPVNQHPHDIAFWR